MSFLIYEEYSKHMHGNQKYIALIAEYLKVRIILAQKGQLSEYLNKKAYSAQLLNRDSAWLRMIFLFKKINKKDGHVLFMNERSFLVALPATLRIKKTWYIKNFRSSFWSDLICFLFSDQILYVAPQCLKNKGLLAKIFQYKTYYLPIGIPLQPFLNIPFKKSADPLQLLMLAAITPEKGIQEALHAMQILSDQPVNLKIAGAVPDKCRDFAQKMRAKSRDLSVQWLGWRADIIQLIAESDIIILPSHSEGVPRSLIEAMAAGRAVIASQVGGIPSMIKSEQTGLLVPPGDAIALAEAIQSLFDEQKRQKLGRSAREYVKKHHDIVDHMNQLKEYME